MRYTYPKSFWLIADQIGHARSVLNQSMLQHNPEFDRGEKSDHVDRVGIAGELIVADYLTRKKVDFTMANLLDLYPSKNPDFIIKEKLRCIGLFIYLIKKMLIFTLLTMKM